ncbi:MULTISPECIES: SUKH-4 family immunity protein [unclassified Streptomyces]|uniref:SUKH-4 family immunity protein n=1 Tax=unclassified Streptomyces TaxID=2593676 RepID=UPI00278C7584|nr:MULTISPECIES: SUKH-4 family immunity protein [unclassified Streptomyces]
MTTHDQDERQTGQLDGGGSPAVTGPGNTAVFTYVDQRTGEETYLTRVSGPGLPPAEYQAWSDLRAADVPAGNVVAIHTDLRPSSLPGGYTLDALTAGFPNATLSFSHPYGPDPAERAEGVAALTAQVESMARLSGQAPPPRPHRVPLPEPAPAAPSGPLPSDLAVRHYEPGLLAAAPLPESTRAALADPGLPADIRFFFTADRPDAPPAGGLFVDASTHLRELGAELSEAAVDILSTHTRIGTDGRYVITVQQEAGTVWAANPASGSGRYVNGSVEAFTYCLADLHTTRARMRGMDPYEAGAAVALLQARLIALDPTCLDDAGNWWSVIVEQLWHGLF